MTLIDYMVKHGVRVSIGHTAAPPAAIREAIARGATLSTHLGNGCAQMLPRHPNFVWEQLAADELSAGFIVDGHHLPPATVKAMMRAKTPGRSILVTDAIIAAGQPPGDYMLGDVRVHVDDTGRVGLPNSPYLAGSALALDRAVGNTVRFTGLPLDQVLPMASTQPAAAVGLKPRGEIDAEWDAATGRSRQTRARLAAQVCRSIGPSGHGCRGPNFSSAMVVARAAIALWLIYFGGIPRAASADIHGTSRRRARRRHDHRAHRGGNAESARGGRGLP